MEEQNKKEEINPDISERVKATIGVQIQDDGILRLMSRAGFEVDQERQAVILPFSGHIGFLAALLHEIEVHNAKNHDYCCGEGNKPLSNFRECEAWGIDPIHGLITRMTDKIKRFQTWSQGLDLKVPDEGIYTIITDLANYLNLLSALMQEKRNRLVEKDEV